MNLLPNELRTELFSYLNFTYIYSGNLSNYNLPNEAIFVTDSLKEPRTLDISLNQLLDDHPQIITLSNQSNPYSAVSPEIDEYHLIKTNKTSNLLPFNYLYLELHYSPFIFSTVKPYFICYISNDLKYIIQNTNKNLYEKLEHLNLLDLDQISQEK